MSLENVVSVVSLSFNLLRSGKSRPIAHCPNHQPKGDFIFPFAKWTAWLSNGFPARLPSCA